MSVVHSNEAVLDQMPRPTVRTSPFGSHLEENYPSLAAPARFKDFFEREGFICMRQAVPKSLCEKAKQAFLKEVLPDQRRCFLRHASGKMEPHVYTEQGFMKYPIMNIQDISNKDYAHFKQAGLEILTQPVLQCAVQTIFNEPGRLIHTMYFDGNQTTWAHRDGHYIDATQPGGMIGIWVAVEDIHPDAGRFYILPRSHRMAVPGEQGDPNGQAYKTLMAEFVKNGPLECLAPILKQGDVLLWSSLTIHGSLPTTCPEYARRSLTGHYVPQSQSFAWRDGSAPSRTLTVNGIPIILHGAQHTFIKDLAHTIDRHFPHLGHLLKEARAQVRGARRRN